MGPWEGSPRDTRVLPGPARPGSGSGLRGRQFFLENVGPCRPGMAPPDGHGASRLPVSKIPRSQLQRK